MRFIHAADLHLDTAFVARSDEVRSRLREASLEALRRLIDLAVSESVDAVILAGDLFDGDRISFQTERLLSTEMARLATSGIQVVYATGNHDPGTATGRGASLDWAPNVHVARVIWSPQMPLRRRLFSVPTSQASELGNAIYANSITLTPGTIALDVRSDTILVHALTKDSQEGLETGDMDRRVTRLEGGGGTP